MPDRSLLEIHGAPPSDRHIPLATVKFIGGLQTQRSPFASIDTRYNSQFLGGKPDALIDGSNVEISNALTLQRRFGLTPAGPSIPAPLAFYEWEQVAPPGLQTIVDTDAAIYNYSLTSAGILLYKSPNAGQTNFWSVVNTLYLGNGVDRFKIVGPNQLVHSNTFTDPSWIKSEVSSVVPGQFDPLGGTSASQINWHSPIVPGLAFLEQRTTPNYTPVAGNTFTFSIWLQNSFSAPSSIQLFISNQSGSSQATQVISLTTAWTKFQLTVTMDSSSTIVVVGFQSLNGSVNPIVYGAQLEVGGPATPTQITTDQPQGVYLWGIVAPTAAPSVTQTALSAYWTPKVYNVGDTITDSNGNLETVTVGGSSGATVPSWPLLPGTTTTDGAVTWVQGGPNGLSPRSGYKWLYSFINELTGHPSNVSPFSPSTSIFSNNLGVSYTISGEGSSDPQVNQIGLYRNVDGGAFWFQVAVFANPPSGGTWTYVDTVQDVNLSSIYAPVGLLNSPPPAKAVNPVWHQSRMWVSVGSDLFFSAAPDNASILNIVQNGVIAESFALANVVPLDKGIVRSWSTTSGLLVWTVGDLWLITGTDLASFNPVRVLAGHGIRSYNAIDSDGSTTWMYTADRQFLSINASAGSVEIGFTIGDVLSAKIDPTKVYVARHVGGSLDNAVFIADGSTGWFRVNPNQVGSSVSGEPSPVWSPFATITGGVKAIASIETSFGVHQLLVGTTGGGSVQSVGQPAGLGTNFGGGSPWLSALGGGGGGSTTVDNVQTATGNNPLVTASGSSSSVNETALLICGCVSSSPPPGIPNPSIGWTHIDDPAGAGNSSMYAKALSTATSLSETQTLSNSQQWASALIFFGSSTGLIPTFVQNMTIVSGAFSTGPFSNPFPVGITAGNGVLVVFSIHNTFVAPTGVVFSDNRGGVYTVLANVTSGSGATIVVAWAPNSIGGATTVTYSASGFSGSGTIKAYEVGGVGLVSPPANLNFPAQPAIVQLNVQGSTGGLDVTGGNSGSGISVSTGAVSATGNNELGITVLGANNSFSNAPTNTTIVTPGAGWTLDSQVSGVAQRIITGGGTGELDNFFTYGSEHKLFGTAGSDTGTATLSRSNSWFAAIAMFKSGSGVAPTVVQQNGSFFYASNSTFTQQQVNMLSSVSQGNFLVVTAGIFGNASSLSVTDSNGNVFTPIQVVGDVAIFLAPIIAGGADTITLTSSVATGALALNVYEITLPATAGTKNSDFLQVTNFNLSVPTNNILGIEVLVTGSQTSSSPDATITLSWINPSGSAPSYTFQLPAVSGTLSFGGANSTWGQSLTQALLSSPFFGFQFQANVATTPNAIFNISAVLVKVFYLNGSSSASAVLFRDTTVFTDAGTPYTWSATIGSLVLASSGELAEVESITTEVRAASGVQPKVEVLLDEIEGLFEVLTQSINDPPQLAPSKSVLSNRFNLNQGETPPLCKHMQVKLSGKATATKDELLSLTIRGARVPENS